MPTELESMWDGHFGWICVANHRVKLVDGETKPVSLAPYRAGPKSREFKKNRNLNDDFLYDNRTLTDEMGDTN